jgi:hypothetical protein
MLRKFFFQRNNFASKGPDFGQKAGQKWPVAPKKRGILATWSVHYFICPKFNPLLDFSAPGPVLPPFSFQVTKNLPYLQ